MAHRKPDPNRFHASKLTLLVDRVMTHFIKVGGVLVVTAVLGIFVFIGSQVLPLLRHAEVKPLATVSLPKGDYVMLGSDEWAALPFVVGLDGKVRFVEMATGTVQESDFGQALTALQYDARSQELIVGTPDGKFGFAKIEYGSTYENGKQKVSGEAKLGPLTAIGREGAPVVAISAGGDESGKLIAVIQKVGEKSEVHVARFTRKRSLMGAGKLVLEKDVDVTALIPGQAKSLLVTSQTDGMVVETSDGQMEYLFRTGDDFTLRQSFQPFGDLPNRGIASYDFLFGDVSLVVTGATGENRIFSLYRKAGDDKRTFGETKRFPALPGGASFFNASLRNKGFITGSGSLASLRYGTTAEVRWQEKLPFTPVRACISGKYNHVLFLDPDSKVHDYALHDPHPESSFKALFGKIWYEGYPAPSYEWQSSGGSDDFEPKLSLVPLLVGTLKGTFYALLFAVPVALLAAIYTSQFLNPNFKGFIKPMMEIMASLPSVVLGFLAALWLAPIIETKVPSILSTVVLVPAAALAFGYGWSRQPIQIRRRIKPERKPLLMTDVPNLMLDLQVGRCDAVVGDLPTLATLTAHAPRRYGPLAGVIRTRTRYG